MEDICLDIFFLALVAFCEKRHVSKQMLTRVRYLGGGISYSALRILIEYPISSCQTKCAYFMRPWLLLAIYMSFHCFSLGFAVLAYQIVQLLNE